MKKFTLLLLASALCATPSLSRTVEKIPFGDFEQWTERHITESAILGGGVKTIYAVAPDSTITENAVYDYSNTVWATSNAYAVVMGITKTSCSVRPDDGPSGKCARLENCFASCKVAGLVSIKVLAGGTLLWGRMREPVTGISDPYAFLDWGIPFTRKPAALILDYKSYLPDSGIITRGTTFKSETFPGHDPAEVLLILQNRWEDQQGGIHATRVGTAGFRIESSSGQWITGRRAEVIYGDASKSDGYVPFMDLLGKNRPYTAVNSRGKSRLIAEEGWAEPGTAVTHAILVISSGSSGSFTGEPGNVLWVDNIRLEYE